ncbi:hypothetical protein [Piscirickettsia litoralis]|uniref:Secreted protein n=1 Tax=Piscirickettsia litoralis TaxID=1891921 RepID=A0ABX3A5V7_9GAMM|nr:hypothetical protein [Piscirickettsia litoralis]ODN41489.1 hypothetical protein BGC07_15355 [Piscirickettsia litoralis]
MKIILTAICLSLVTITGFASLNVEHSHSAEQRAMLTMEQGQISSINSNTIIESENQRSQSVQAMQRVPHWNR